VLIQLEERHERPRRGGQAGQGTSVNQVPRDGPVLVTAGTAVATSGLILAAA
jgi:hypothetical protein